MGAQPQNKTAPLVQGASNPNEGASTLQALQGTQNQNVSTVAQATGGQKDQTALLQQYLSSLLSQ